MSISKVWVVSELYYPEDTSTGYFLTGIAEGLAERFRVRVLCGQPSYRFRGIRTPRKENRNGVIIERCEATRFPRNRLWLRFLNIVTFGASVFLRALTCFRTGDAVLVVTNPPILPFLISLACRLRGCWCVLLVHDVYPDALVATGMIRNNSAIARLLRGVERMLFRSVHRVITLGRDMEELVRSRCSRNPSKILIIPNWGDLDEIHPKPREASRLLQELRLRASFVVQYSGNIGRTHGIETILQCAENLQSDPHIRFLIIGSGAKRGLVERAVAEKRVDNVILLKDRARCDLADALLASDVALISFLPGMVGISVPSRLYNIMAAGRPIVAVAEEPSELARVVREEQIGWVVPPGNPEVLAQVLLEGSRNAPLLLEMGKRARAAAERKYGYSTTKKAYQELFEEMLGPGPSNQVCRL